MSSLTIDESALYPDIQDILKKHEDKYVSVFSMGVKLHTEEKDLDYTDGLILVGVNSYRDYVNSIADYTEVSIYIPVGTYLFDVYPYLENIEVTLFTIKQLHVGGDPHIEIDRYKAIYLPEKNKAKPDVTVVSKKDFNQQLPMVLTLQLLDRSAEAIRIKTTQGNFDSRINEINTDMSTKCFLNSILSAETNKILIENNPSIDVINIEEPDNKDQLLGITIRSYTRVIEIPEYIQKKNIGMYLGGIGSYIQKHNVSDFEFKKGFFVYSLYNVKKYDKEEFKAIFYIPNVSAYSTTDITYKFKDKTLKVLPRTNVKFSSNKETRFMSTGSGFRISNANSYMNKPTVITEEGPKFDRNRVDTEITIKERNDNLNFAPNRGISNNIFSLSSDILEKSGFTITLSVLNLDPDYIYPGMSCKVVYENENGEVKELLGVIHNALIGFNSNTTNMNQNYTSEYVSLYSDIKLTVFVQEEETNDIQDS